MEVLIPTLFYEVEVQKCHKSYTIYLLEAMLKLRIQRMRVCFLSVCAFSAIAFVWQFKISISILHCSLLLW